MKKLALVTILTGSALLSSTLVSGQAFAVEGLSANIGATSNYIWRGVSQTNGSAAVSGSIDYVSDAGFYAGTWTSNVDFGDDTAYELDFYLGKSGDIGKGFSYDLGYIYYAYPDAGTNGRNGDYDFGEAYASVGYGAFSLTINKAVNNGDDAELFSGAMYISGDAAFEVFNEILLSLHIGSSSFDEASNDYLDYGVSLSKSNFTFGLTVSDVIGDDAMKAYVSYSVDIVL
jgi:uncharacterized protein (TIGR02001 family)